MERMLILGGTGYTGKLIARYLLEYSDAQVTLATRHIDKAQAMAAEFNCEYPGDRVSCMYADAADSLSLREAYRGHAMVVVASPTTTHAETVIRTALEAGIDYLDVQLGDKKLKLLQQLSGEIESAGRCFITEAGFHPGLPSALVRYAASQMDEVESAITAGYLNMGKNLPYTEAVDELVEAFKDYQSQVYRGGHWTKTGTFDMRKIDFGSDIGRKLCYSMFFEEMLPLPGMYPSLKEVGFYMSELHWISDWVVMPLAFLWMKVAPNAVRPIGKFIFWGMHTFHKPPYRVELMVQAAGSKNSKPTHFRASVAHADGYVLTAVPVAATLLQYLDGSARKPGMWMMGHLAEPVRLMADMEKMGLLIKSSTSS
jgi:saccharopine dehydrogenase (NAD+, L-lysine-forming)